MSKTTELRKQLRAIIKAQTANVYYVEAPDTKPYPYAVHELTEISYDDGRTLMELEVNVLDYGKDSSAAEEIADKIQSALHKYFFINHAIEFTVYQGMRNIVKEEDKQVIRRRLLFEVHLHEKKGE